MNNGIECKNCKTINKSNIHYCQNCGTNLTDNMEFSDMLRLLKTITGIGTIITFICLIPDLLASFFLTSIGGKIVLIFIKQIKPILFIVLLILHFLLRTMHKQQLKKNLRKKDNGFQD